MVLCHEGPNFCLKRLDEVPEQLQNHYVFDKLILRAMQLPEKCSSSPVASLDQGKDTSLVYAKRIAEYNGLLTGEELRMLRAARTNLEIFY